MSAAVASTVPDRRTSVQVLARPREVAGTVAHVTRDDADLTGDDVPLGFGQRTPTLADVRR